MNLSEILESLQNPEILIFWMFSIITIIILLTPFILICWSNHLESKKRKNRSTRNFRGFSKNKERR